MSAAAGRAGTRLSGSHWRRGDVSLGPVALIAPRNAVGARSGLARASGLKVPRTPARLRSEPLPTLPVGAFAVGRDGVSRPIEGLDSLCAVISLRKAWALVGSADAAR